MLNFWYASCAPCRLEAPDLQALSEEFADGARFYGVNIRDERPTAEAFERNFGITYPSFMDKDGGILLAMTSYVPPRPSPPRWCWTRTAGSPPGSWAWRTRARSKP